MLRLYYSCKSREGAYPLPLTILRTKYLLLLNVEHRVMYSCVKTLNLKPLRTLLLENISEIIGLGLNRKRLQSRQEVSTTALLQLV